MRKIDALAAGAVLALAACSKPPISVEDEHNQHS
jgi:hypothetical protein